MPRSSKDNVLFPILLVNFIGTLGFSIVLPFLVFLVTRLGGNAIIYGIIGATYSVFQLFGAPILGKLSDVHGRRKILLISQLGTMISWAVFLVALVLPQTVLGDFDSPVLGQFALTLPLLLIFFSRALDGATGGNISVANAYLADITKEEDRSRNYGKMSVSANLGFIFGPALAGLLGATAIGESLPVLAALVISLIATIVIAFYLPESKRCTLRSNPEAVSVRKVFGQEHKECYELEGEQAIGFREMLHIKRIPLMFGLYFLIFLGFNLFYTAFPMHAVKGLGWTVTETGLFFSTLSIMMVLVQGPILSRASAKFSDGALIIFGSLVLAGNFALMTAHSRPALFLGAAFFAIGNGLMWPSVLSLLSKIAGDKIQGAVQGAASSIGSLASIIGLLLGGFFYETIAEQTFMIAAGIVLVVFILSFRLRTAA